MNAIERRVRMARLVMLAEKHKEFADELGIKVVHQFVEESEEESENEEKEES